MLSTIMTALKRIIGNILKTILKQTKQFCRLLMKIIAGNILWKTCHEPKPSKVFNIRSWVKQLEEPIKDFNIKPPTYNEINKIMKMKSFSSSCPINQVSILMLKKCPIQYLFIRRVTQMMHQTLDLLH